MKICTHCFKQNSLYKKLAIGIFGTNCSVPTVSKAFTVAVSYTLFCYQENRKWRNEKIHGAPLCESDCADWYNDCKDDMTCVTNWSKDFNWATGTSNINIAGYTCDLHD